MNELTLSALLSEICGGESIDKHDLVRTSIFINQSMAMAARYAPSVATRSECILFGISMPRFAIRLYLTGGGFINCRRLQGFAAHAYYDNSAEWGDRYLDTDIPADGRNPDVRADQLANESILEILDGQSCIADGLLRAPEHLKRYKFHYTSWPQVDLFAAYCEARPELPGVYTPYIRSMNFGGGLCAQAVCFMATVILAQHAKKICGLAEITAYAHCDKCCELLLSGLTARQMGSYFEKVGLLLTEQSPSQEHRTALTERQKRDLTMALRSYISSNIPVIFPVNIRAFTSVYKANCWKVVADDLSPTESHGILLLGSSLMRDKKDQEQFIFHDPSGFPYMKVTTEQLAMVGCLDDKNNNARDNGLFMPITPSAARMPLLYHRASDEDGQMKPFTGLFELSTLFHYYILDDTQSLPFRPKIPFILSNGVITEEQLAELPEELRGDFLQVLEQLVAIVKSKLGDKWIWYELHPHAVFLWDAEREGPRLPPETYEQCLDYLLGYVTRNGTVGEVTGVLVE